MDQQVAVFLWTGKKSLKTVISNPTSTKADAAHSDLRNFDRWLC